MRTFKTPKKDRTNYIYYTATGEKIEITPGDVDSTWIAVLHEDDDTMIDADRRESYHVPLRYDSLTDAEGDADGLSEKLDFLADPELNPLEHIINMLECEEHEELLEKLRTAIQTLQPQQIALVQKVFYEGRTCASIASEEGVSRAALHYRLKKIYAALEKRLAV